MIDRITQLVFACACLAFAFGLMNITLSTQGARPFVEDEAKCEVAKAWVDRWTKSDGSLRYYDVEVRPVPTMYFADFCRGFYCNPQLESKLRAMPLSKCGLEPTGVVDTLNPTAYLNENEMLKNESIINLGVHYIEVSPNRQTANLYVSRYVLPTDGTDLYCSTGIYKTVSAKKTDHRWTFIE